MGYFIESRETKKECIQYCCDFNHTTKGSFHLQEKSKVRLHNNIQTPDSRSSVSTKHL